MLTTFLDAQINLVLWIGAAVVLLLGIFSGYINNRWAVSEPIVCLIIGALISPTFIGVFTPRLNDFQQFELLQQAARVTLSISVMGAALRLGPRYVETHWRELAVVLGPGMLLMWLASSGVVALLFSLPPLLTLLIGAVMAPTDPVLSDAIISSQGAERHVPHRLRSILTAESGANDGLGMLFVTLPMALMSGPVTGLSDWFARVVLWETLGSMVLGALLGLGAGHLLRWVRRQTVSQGTSFLAVGVALALTVLTTVELMGGGGILAVFTAGVAFNRVTAVEEGGGRSEHIDEAITRFFDLPVFILIGFFLPWQGWFTLGWKAWLFPLMILLLRRLPAWFLLQHWVPTLRAPRETAFVGWFGPVGVAALYYAAGSAKALGDPAIWTITSLVIVASILVHGSSATPVTLRYRHKEPVRKEDD